MSLDLSSSFHQFRISMGEGGKSGVFTFNGFRLDVGNLMLYRNGEELVLAPKVVRTLAVLVEEAGNIITKEELINRVWDDSIVEESNLSQNLYILRKTLGSKPDGSRYIETLRRRGYRFTADDVAVETSNASSSSTPPIEAATPSRYSVERRGNVLALADWKEPEAEPSDETPLFAAVTAGPAADEANKTRLMLVVGAGALVVLAAMGAVVWYNSTRAAQVSDEIAVGIEAVPLTNGDYVAEATISRDGNYFTYHEIDGDYSRMLVQQTGQPKPLEILPRAKRTISGKTFSPDGQFVYYLAREGAADHSSVYRIPTLGGVSTKIIEYSNSHVSFSPDGKSFAFVRTDPVSGVYSVNLAASDGTDERTLGSAEPGTFFAPNPAWSPDGKEIVFGNVTIGGPTSGKCTISAMDVETSSIKPLSSELWDTCYRIEWRPDGKGIVLVGTKLSDAVTIRRDQVYYLSIADGKARRLTSDPSRKQSESLGITSNNEVLAVPFSRSSQLWVMDPKGSSKTASRLTNGSSDGRSGLVPLKDGRIAFITRTGENLGIWTIDADGGNRRQILSDPPLLEELRATPDGKYFFFSHETENRTHLYRVDADGTNMKQITDGEDYQTDSTPSPDGKWIAFDSTPAPGTGQRIWRTSIEGGAPTQISDQLCAVPHYSPSGKFISCVWSTQLFVLSPEDGKVVKTFTTVQIAMLNIGVRWTPDEKALVYIASQKGTTNLWIQPLDGKPARQLTDFVDGDIYNFAYSHDGSKLYLARGYQVRDAILIKNFQ